MPPSQERPSTHLSSPHLRVTAAPWSPALGWVLQRGLEDVTIPLLLKHPTPTHTSSCCSTQMPRLPHSPRGPVPPPHLPGWPCQVVPVSGPLHWLLAVPEGSSPEFPQLGPRLPGLSSNAPHGETPPAAIQKAHCHCSSHRPYCSVLPVRTGLDSLPVYCLSPPLGVHLAQAC